jgi:Putative phage holin Dp-1
MLRGKVYDVLKAVALIYLPALGVLYGTLAVAWHFPAVSEVTQTILAIDTFLGVVLGLSSSAYNKSDDKYDGKFVAVETDQGTAIKLASVDYHALSTKNELLFKLDTSLLTDSLTHPESDPK